MKILTKHIHLRTKLFCSWKFEQPYMGALKSKLILDFYNWMIKFSNNLPIKCMCFLFVNVNVYCQDSLCNSQETSLIKVDRL